MHVTHMYGAPITGQALLEPDLSFLLPTGSVTLSQFLILSVPQFPPLSVGILVSLSGWQVSEN